MYEREKSGIGYNFLFANFIRTKNEKYFLIEKYEFRAF